MGDYWDSEIKNELNKYRNLIGGKLKKISEDYDKSSVGSTERKNLLTQYRELIGGELKKISTTYDILKKIDKIFKQSSQSDDDKKFVNEFLESQRKEYLELLDQLDNQLDRSDNPPISDLKCPTTPEECKEIFRKILANEWTNEYGEKDRLKGKINTYAGLSGGSQQHSYQRIKYFDF